MRYVICAVFVALFLAGGAVRASAGPFEDAHAAYDAGDYQTALRLLKLLAEQGDADAQHNVGVMYDKGRGVPQNYAEALKWYRRAAEQGNALAQNNLGAMYDNGQGVPQNYAEAIKWYRRAAEQGYAAAQNNLGTMYENGRAVPQNYVLAHMWFNLAGAAGQAPALKNRDLVAHKMTPAQLAEAQRLAAEWKPKAPSR